MVSIVDIARRRLLALAAPAVIPAAMIGVFRAAQARLDERGAYTAGFVTYWAVCAGISTAILGRRGVKRALSDSSTTGDLSGIDVVLLAWPPVGAVTTRLIPELATSTPAMLATTAVVAQTNAVLEELLWRASYVSLWPENPWLAYVWPQIGFALWHLAPQVIHPSSMGARKYALASLFLGLSWGRVAWRTGSIRWTTLSHVVTDGSGLENSRFFLSASDGG